MYIYVHTCQESPWIYTLLEQSLKKNKLFQKKKITKKLDYKNIMENKKFNLIINCEKNNIFIRSFLVKEF